MARILSIEIDNRNIKILEGSKHGASLAVFKSIFLDVEPGCIDDGRITDIDTVVDIIEKALKKYNVKTKNAIITINTNSIITRNIELPILKSKSDTMSMIQNELDQLISVDLSQYKLIYKRTEIIKSDEGEKGKYIVYGLPISMYKQYIELSEKLKLEMVSLGLSFNSLDKISEEYITINKKVLEKNVASAFIDFGYDTISFSILNNGMNDFSRILSNGMKDMIRNYATVFNLSHEEALNGISKLSFSENYEDLSDSSKTNIAENVIDGWIDEFNRYIRYYNSINKDRQIKKIYIYGTYANLIGLEQYLSSRLNIETETVNEISALNIKHTNDTVDLDIKVFFNTLLSLYLDKKDINFLSDKKKKHKSKFNAAIVLMAASLVLVLTLAFYLYSYIVKQSALEKEIATMNQFMENEENIKLNSEAENLKNKVLLLEKYKNEVDKVKAAISNEDAVTTIMFEEVGKATPLGSKVNSMSIDKSTIQLQCSSNSKLEVAQFEKNLKDVEFIDYVYIPAVVESAEGGKISYTYSVVCEIKDVMTDEAE